MLRKFKFIAIAVAMLLILTGCKLKEKISENIVEGVLEKATGGEADIEVDGGDISYTDGEGEVTIKKDEGVIVEGEDGSVISSGSEYTWPEGQAADYLPKYEGGKITFIMNSQESCMIFIEGTNKDEYKSYVEKITDKGYSIDTVESAAEDMLLYYAKSEQEIAVSVCYVPSEKTLQITLDASGKQ